LALVVPPITILIVLPTDNFVKNLVHLFSGNECEMSRTSLGAEDAIYCRFRDKGAEPP